VLLADRGDVEGLLKLADMGYSKAVNSYRPAKDVFGGTSDLERTMAALGLWDPELNIDLKVAESPLE
jgi:hypothetical protein